MQSRAVRQRRRGGEGERGRTVALDGGGVVDEGRRHGSPRRISPRVVGRREGQRRKASGGRRWKLRRRAAAAEWSGVFALVLPCLTFWPGGVMDWVLVHRRCDRVRSGALACASHGPLAGVYQDLVHVTPLAAGFPDVFSLET